MFFSYHRGSWSRIAFVYIQLYGSASAGRKALVANFRWNTTVVGSGASTLSTITKWLCRALLTPSGGSMSLFQLADTSSAVSAEPSWNLTPSRILKAYVLPSSLGRGISLHRSQT